MCNFYSCIVDRKLNILDAIELDDSHETIITNLKLKDNKLKDRDIVRLEITPDIEKLTKKFDKKIWTYKVDEEKTLPDWYTKNEKKIQSKIFDRIHDVICQKYILVDKEIENSTNRISICKNATIGQLYHNIGIMWWSSQVKEMWESSQVGIMRGSSQVGIMWGSSQVGIMWGSSQVGIMRESSQVGIMREFSQVKEMRGSSQVGIMRGSSQVKEMWESSQVKEMWESSQVKEMWESSQVKEMWESSQVKEMRGSSQVTTYNDPKNIKKQNGGNTVIIDRSGDKVGDKVKVKIG
ncbi:hypothetical protein M0R01_05000 [bacterium]|nr:hypothetical protein [bacterium]